MTTGVYYTDQQLAGPYVVQTQVHNLYPPHALYLFVPFLFLPGILWWALPLAFLAYVIWWCRPTAWTWVLLLGLLALPKGPAQILFGNTDMWIAAFGGGCRALVVAGCAGVDQTIARPVRSAGRAVTGLVAGRSGTGPHQPPAVVVLAAMAGHHPAFERAAVLLVRQLPVLHAAHRRVARLSEAWRDPVAPMGPRAAGAAPARSGLTVDTPCEHVDRGLRVAVYEAPSVGLVEPVR